MLDKEKIASIISEDRFADSHGASLTENHLGTGMLYYTIPYMLKAKLCVCLGSGSGFVPKLMREAQRDLNISDARTILIDADVWNPAEGIPDYHDRETKFRRDYPDVEVWRERTSVSASKFHPRSINYLHIDADHSYEGVQGDFQTYFPLMSNGGMISFHDTNSHSTGVPRFIDNLRAWSLEMLIFPEGAGCMLMQVDHD